MGIPVLIHAIADGRDVSPSSAPGYFATLQEQLPQGAQICTVIGRYYALDRDNRWERVQTAYSAIAQGAASKPPPPKR